MTKPTRPRRLTLSGRELASLPAQDRRLLTRFPSIEPQLLQVQDLQLPKAFDRPSKEEEKEPANQAKLW